MYSSLSTFWDPQLNLQYQQWGVDSQPFPFLHSSSPLNCSFVHFWQFPSAPFSWDGTCFSLPGQVIFQNPSSSSALTCKPGQPSFKAQGIVQSSLARPGYHSHNFNQILHLNSKGLCCLDGILPCCPSLLQIPCLTFRSTLRPDCGAVPGAPPYPTSQHHN